MTPTMPVPALCTDVSWAMAVNAASNDVALIPPPPDPAGPPTDALGDAPELHPAAAIAAAAATAAILVRTFMNDRSLNCLARVADADIHPRGLGTRDPATISHDGGVPGRLSSGSRRLSRGTTGSGS